MPSLGTSVPVRGFFAGMTTTQRSEGVNSFVKKVVARSMRVHKLVEEFDKGLIRWRLKELVADYKSKHTTPVLQTGLRTFEEHACNNYTYACFRKGRLAPVKTWRRSKNWQRPEQVPTSLEVEVSI